MGWCGASLAPPHRRICDVKQHKGFSSTENEEEKEEEEEEEEEVKKMKKENGRKSRSCFVIRPFRDFPQSKLSHRIVIPIKAVSKSQ